MNIPKGAEIRPSGHINDDDFHAAADACQAFNFAVVRRAIPRWSHRRVKREVREMTQLFNRGAPSWRKTFTETDGKNWGYHTRDSYQGNLAGSFPACNELAQIFQLGMANAAYARTPRVDLGLDIESKTAYVNTLPRGGFVERHYDARQPGIVIAFNVVGIAHTELTDACNNLLAEFDVYPRDAVILPAIVGKHGGPYDQAWHKITNITPRWRNGGIRQSFVLGFQTAELEPVLDNNTPT